MEQFHSATQTTIAVIFLRATERNNVHFVNELEAIFPPLSGNRISSPKVYTVGTHQQFVYHAGPVKHRKHGVRVNVGLCYPGKLISRDVSVLCAPNDAEGGVRRRDKEPLEAGSAARQQDSLRKRNCVSCGLIALLDAAWLWIST